MRKIKLFLKTVKRLYHPVELVLMLLVLFAINFGYFHLISENMIVSIIVGILGMGFFFYKFSYKTKQLNIYQEQLSSLLKYVTNMKFFLQTGENVLYSLINTLPTLTDAQVKKDIQHVIDGLEDDAVLQTEHFRKYSFPSMDQFHENLAISYEHGGDPKELFDSVHRSMMTELEKRDELYKLRKSFSRNVYFLLALVAVIPIMLRFMVTNLWDIFLSYSVASTSILLFTVAAMILILSKLQKHKMDISVRI